MKKTIVAVAVAALAATSANAATIYAKDGTTVNVSGSLRLMLDKTTDHRADLEDDGSRLIIDVKHELGEGFSALANIQTRTGDLGGKGDKGFRTKYVYAGFAQENIGTLTFGKQVTAGDSFKLADPTENFTSILDATGIKDAADKVVNFKSANFAGFGVETSYIFDNSSERYDAKDNYQENENGYQILAKYENNFDGLGFAAHAMYSHKKGEQSVAMPASADFDKTTLTNGITLEDGTLTFTDTVKSWGLGAGVEFAGFGFAADYVDTKLDKFDSKIKAWQLATTYQVTDAVDAYMAYHQFKYDDEKVKGFAIGSHYNLNQNVQTYVEYTTEKGTWEKADRDNKYYAGLRVFF